MVLESLQGNFRVYGEALQGYGEALQGFRAEVGARFDQVDTRLNGIDARLNGIDGDVGLLKDAVLANTRELKNHGRQLDELRAVVANGAGGGRDVTR